MIQEKEIHNVLESIFNYHIDDFFKTNNFKISKNNIKFFIPKTDFKSFGIFSAKTIEEERFTYLLKQNYNLRTYSSFIINKNEFNYDNNYKIAINKFQHKYNLIVTILHELVHLIQWELNDNTITHDTPIWYEYTKLLGINEFGNKLITKKYNYLILS